MKLFLVPYIPPPRISMMGPRTDVVPWRQRCLGDNHTAKARLEPFCPPSGGPAPNGPGDATSPLAPFRSHDRELSLGLTEVPIHLKHTHTYSLAGQGRGPTQLREVLGQPPPTPPEATDPSYPSRLALYTQKRFSPENVQEILQDSPGLYNISFLIST